MVPAEARPGDLVPAARAARRLGLLGGSFDPPHRGHLHVAGTAREAFRLDHVVFVPAARPPHKPERVLAGGRERLAMLELLLAEVDWASTWDVELDRAGPSYTLDTVRELGARTDPGGELFLLLGTDNLPGLPGWYRVGELLALARPVVVRRGGAEADLRPLARVLAGGAEAAEEAFVDVPPYDAAATDIRARLVAGEDPGPALPAALHRHIRTHKIYSTRHGPPS